jgi:hypothetical protein
MSSSSFFERNNSQEIKLPDELKEVAALIGEAKLAKLLQINPRDESRIPEDSGHCQLAAIEAAKVLLDDAYQPRALSNIEIAEGDNQVDPIECSLKEKIKPFLYNQIDDNCLAYLSSQMQNGELLIVNGESVLDHAYIIFKMNERLFLIDADRGVFKQINNAADLTHIVFGNGDDEGWPDQAMLDYGQFRFMPNKSKDELQSEDESKIDDEKAILHMYKITKKDFSFLPDTREQVKKTLHD